MVRCACGLEAVIRTSWTNWNPRHHFYGCPTLSSTCVNFLRWYDPPMCQRSVQIIRGLLRSRNELKEIVAMVEEKRRKEKNLLHVLSRRTEHSAVFRKALFSWMPVEVIDLKKELRLQAPPQGG
ncbi:zinc finger, GRF-type containing protein [Tanacetum coccineum]|uniref:Zinc finger, GRF-type containing protein n=1 Tax=Tanacetum coccineum TaxID=301880 RepID=A0ABQ5IV39_9ASTR